MDMSLDGEGAGMAPVEADARRDSLELKAAQCRRLAAGISDRQAATVLRSMASVYEKRAAKLGA